MEIEYERTFKMQEIQIFNNAEFGSVRTLEVNGEPYFVGKDVAEILGYAKPENAIATHVDNEDKTTTLIQGTGSNYKSNAVVINESGLYSLILSSKLPTAKKFKHWVTSEVLPSIRKHGAYMTPQVIEQTLTNPDFLIQLATTLKNEQEKNRQLTNAIAVQGQQITELTPKASYYDVILNCPDLLSVTKIAKDYGKSAIWLNNCLHDNGVQFKQGDIWLLYQKYAEQGYTSTKTHSYNGDDGQQHSKVNTYWTQKGRLFIYDLLKTDGIVPVIERSEVA